MYRTSSTEVSTRHWRLRAELDDRDDAGIHAPSRRATHLALGMSVVRPSQGLLRPLLGLLPSESGLGVDWGACSIVSTSSDIVTVRRLSAARSGESPADCWLSPTPGRSWWTTSTSERLHEGSSSPLV